MRTYVHPFNFAVWMLTLSSNPKERAVNAKQILADDSDLFLASVKCYFFICFKGRDILLNIATHIQSEYR